MGERSQHFCLAKQPFSGVVSLSAQNLERHRLPIQQVAPTENHPHAPAAHQRFNLEALTETPLLTHHEGRFLLGLEPVLVPHGVRMNRLPRNGAVGNAIGQPAPVVTLMGIWRRKPRIPCVADTPPL